MKKTVLFLMLILPQIVLGQTVEKPTGLPVPGQVYGRNWQERPDGNIPYMNFDERMQGQYTDRSVIESKENPAPVIPYGDEENWISGMAHIVDGDSFGMNGTLYRLAGIDAPELDHLCYSGNMAQSCGLKSQAWLAHLMEGERTDCHIHYTDAVDRKIVTCWVRGIEVNSEAVKTGMALRWVGAESPYIQEEEEARLSQAGIWASDFRHPAEWRDIMDQERKLKDERIRNGELSSVPGFPYRHGEIGRSIPIYDAGN